MRKPINEFIQELSSKSPTPGGGGASALIGAIGVSLCSMVANLTLEKGDYSNDKNDMKDLLARIEGSISHLIKLIQKDAEVFEPLSIAYTMPIDVPNREDILEEALKKAASVPMEILQEVSGAIDIIEVLLSKGIKLAISDVGVAASACRSAMEGAAMNVYINTKLMRKKDYAIWMNAKVDEILKEDTLRLERIYNQVLRELKN